MTAEARTEALTLLVERMWSTEDLPEDVAQAVLAGLRPLLEHGPNTRVAIMDPLRSVAPPGRVWLLGLGNVISSWPKLSAKDRETTSLILLYGPAGRYAASKPEVEQQFRAAVAPARYDLELAESAGSVTGGLIAETYLGMWFETLDSWYGLSPHTQQQLMTSLTDAGLASLETSEEILKDAERVPQTPYRRMPPGAAVDTAAAGLRTSRGVREGTLYAFPDEMVFYLNELKAGEEPGLEISYDELVGCSIRKVFLTPTAKHLVMRTGQGSLDFVVAQTAADNFQQLITAYGKQA